MSQFTLPHRHGEAPRVGETIPQLQFSDLSPDDIRNKLWGWAFTHFDDVTEEDTRISVPTSRAMWLDPKVSALAEILGRLRVIAQDLLRSRHLDATNEIQT